MVSTIIIQPPSPLTLLRQARVIGPYDEEGNEVFEAAVLREDHKTLALVAAQIYHRFANKNIDIVAGISEKGLPLASSVAGWSSIRSHSPTTVIRVNKRDSGEFELESCLAAIVKDRRVLVVDYRIKKGDTLMNAIRTLQQAGAIVVGAGVICLETEDFRNPNGVPICAVVRIQDGWYVERKTS